MLTTETTPTVEKLYRPRGAAKALFPCRDPEILLEGPAGTGKSLGALEKANRCLLKYPGCRVLIVRKTRASMTESVLVTYETKVIPDNPDLYPLTNNVTRQNRHSYEYPNGSSLVVGGLDRPERLMSTEYDLIVAFEATELTENDWELLQTRLRNGVMPFQQSIADCNPGPPTHWLNQRANAGKMTRLLSRHEDNPRLYGDDGKWTAAGQTYLGTLSRLSGARKLRLLSGKWATQEGVVYDAYDAAVHLIDPFPVPADWRRIRSIDFGYSNPFVCQWWAIDPDGRMYLYREMYHTKRLVSDHASGMKDPAGTVIVPGIVQWSAGESYEATISDHDAEDRATLDREGVRTQAAYKAISTGIQAVQARLAPAGDGKPRLFLMRGARVEEDAALVAAKLPTSTEQEIDGYAYPKAADGKPIKEDPLKLNDHGMDCMRYAVAFADKLHGFTLRLSTSAGVGSAGTTP